MPIGWFRSASDEQGPHGRGVEVKPVEDLLAANPVVTSMILHATAGRVYITCVPTDYGFTTGVRLVWDYLQGGVWSIDLLGDPDAPSTTQGARCAFVANTAASGLAYHWVTSAGRVYRETNGVGASSYMDAGQWVTMKFTSAWLKPAQAGFARFWRWQLDADSLDPSDFSVTLAFDYLPTTVYSESASWNAGAQAAQFYGFPVVNVQGLVGNQKAKAVQVTLTDFTPSGLSAVTGQGPSWSSISFEIGVKDGGYRNVPTRQRG